MATDEDIVQLSSSSDSEEELTDGRIPEKSPKKSGDGGQGMTDDVKCLVDPAHDPVAAATADSDKCAGTSNDKVLLDDDLDFLEILEKVPSVEPTANGSRPILVVPPTMSVNGGQEMDCIIIDDVDPLAAANDIAQEHPDKAAARSELEDMFYKLRDVMKMNDRKKVKDKFWKLFEAADFENRPGAKDKLVPLIQDLVAYVGRKGKESWPRILKIENCLKELKFKPRSLPAAKPPNETEEEREERKKKERIILLEKKLKQLERKIAEWDQREVDWDEEENSAYLVKCRMVKKYMEMFKLLCKINNCNYYTGRPIEKRIKIKDGVTRFPEIKSAVENFMNSKDTLFVPDFHDIKRVVASVNDQSRPPLLCDEEVEPTAKELFREVVRIMKYRRLKDTEISLPDLAKVKDPAEDDPELERKLAENAASKKSEAEVVEEFVRKQEELHEESQEVGEPDEGDSSAPEDDDTSSESDEGDGAADDDDDDDGVSLGDDLIDEQEKVAANADDNSNGGNSSGSKRRKFKENRQEYRRDQTELEDDDDDDEEDADLSPPAPLPPRKGSSSSEDEVARKRPKIQQDDD